MDLWLVIFSFLVSWRTVASAAMSREEKLHLRDEAKEMFYHAYNSYMKYAFPADELMPLSCRGRYRGSEPSRGDIDDALGNFTLTLVDTLDTLLVLGDIEEFERAVGLVVKTVTFDHDIVVSVFETNIRMIGGLMSGHILAEYVKERLGDGHLSWYRGELLAMAKDLGLRLLPAFNTTTGLPHTRVNLRYGVNGEEFITSRETCTACAGTMILELAALSRLSGEPVFEEKARKALDALWSYRHRSSDLVGTVLNVHNGDWVRRDSGVGAGIDSYYEYLLKAYILLGDDTLLNRFNKHYQAVMKYVSQGPLLIDVHMHRPHTNSRNFMDALLAFWPGLQVLKGDIKPAIETHEMLYQVMQRHNFLPEAFTTDFQVHWGQHPLRPEFVESTYLLYKATNDPHYLDVGKTVLRSLQKYARVPCGFAAVKDVRTGQHEDRMDSFVLAETFKYLYLLFAESSDLILDLDQFVFTTEAHLLPLSLARLSNYTAVPMRDGSEEIHDEDVEADRSCPNIHFLLPESHTSLITAGNALSGGLWPSAGSRFAESVRKGLKNFVHDVCPSRSLAGISANGKRLRLAASQFDPTNMEHLRLLKQMGISIMALPDGRVQLLHSSADAESAEGAAEGIEFMQDMVAGATGSTIAVGNRVENIPQSVSWASMVDEKEISVHSATAGPAQFGKVLSKDDMVGGKVVVADPIQACTDMANADSLKEKIAIVKRGNCMFVDKARRVAKAGAVGAIVIDNVSGTNAKDSPIFAMSGDGTDDVAIPAVFLFEQDGVELLKAVENDPNLEVVISGGASSSSNDQETTGTGKVSRVDLDLSPGEGANPLNHADSTNDAAMKVARMNPSLEKMKLFIHEYQRMREKEKWLKASAKTKDYLKDSKDVTTVKFLDNGSQYVRDTQGYESFFTKFMEGLPRLSFASLSGMGTVEQVEEQKAAAAADEAQEEHTKKLSSLEETLTAMLTKAIQSHSSISTEPIPEKPEEKSTALPDGKFEDEAQSLSDAVATLKKLSEDLKASASAPPTPEKEAKTEADAEQLLDKSIETLRTLSSYITKVSQRLTQDLDSSSSEKDEL